jgi:hypothetical protein
MLATRVHKVEGKRRTRRDDAAGNGLVIRQGCTHAKPAIDAQLARVAVTVAKPARHHRHRSDPRNQAEARAQGRCELGRWNRPGDTGDADLCEPARGLRQVSNEGCRRLSATFKRCRRRASHPGPAPLEAAVAKIHQQYHGTTRRVTSPATIW